MMVRRRASSAMSDSVVFHAQRSGDYFRMVKIESKSEIPILDEAKFFDISLLGNFPDFDRAKSNILDFNSILTAPK